MEVGGLPDEFLRMKMCRDLFHCTPGQLAEEDWIECKTMLLMHNCDIEHRNKK